MTKARDLAGFSTGSITNTTADGLILKGDGSSTDVVIKNGANATVASVADGTVNIAAAGSITATGAVTRALTRGSIDVGNASGVSAPLAKGAAGTVLTSDGTDLSFAAVQAGASSVVWPSDFASPTNTYTSSGTWSKGSLADTDYVWVYLVGGGGGGGYASNGYSVGGGGGSALLLYGKAQWFNGGAYVIGAGGTSTSASNSLPTATTFTLSSSNNSTVFTTGNTGGNSESQTGVNIFKIIEGKTIPITIVDQVVTARISPTSTFFLPATIPTIPNLNTSGDKKYNTQTDTRGGYLTSATNSVFGGGGGEGAYAGSPLDTRGGSLYAGRGAAYNSGTAGAVPGGGGCGGTSTSGSSDGGAGNVRVYHV